jgi:flavin-dependent dehydrogenase
MGLLLDGAGSGIVVAEPGSQPTVDPEARLQSSARRESQAAFDYDVAVIGGGPAGSSAAAIVAKAGHRVVLFERDRFPRFHIGESLLASVNDAFDALGIQDKIRRAGFPEKWGATFSTGDGSIERYAGFADAGGVPQPQTWQVERARFDALLLDHAAECGVDVRVGSRVLDATMDFDGVSVEVGALPGSPVHNRQVGRVKAIIDASGRWGLLARKLSLRVEEPKLANIGIFSHYAGVPRQEGRPADDIRLIARDDLGWFWMIPISAALTSVGVVLRRSVFDSWAHSTHEAALDRAIGETPLVARLMQRARREWPVRVEKDFSYGARRYAGDRWLLAGDAGSFLDPIFSTGVAIALESGVEAGQAVAAALDRDDLKSHQFATFDRRQRARYKAFRRFVIGFYTREFRDLFFAADPPPPIFNAVVRLLAGYWQSSLSSRVFLEAFYTSVWLQKRIGFTNRVPGVGSAPRTASSEPGASALEA